MLLDTMDHVVIGLAARYVERLRLPTENLWLTTNRATFATWIGRRVPSAYGGAYVYIEPRDVHAILINMDRIDQAKHYAVEVVVAE